MKTGNVDIQSKFVQALRTQGKTEWPLNGALPCPYGHPGRMFQSLDQLYDHAKTEHEPQFSGLKPNQIRKQLKDAVIRLRKSDSSSEATARGSAAPNIESLILESDKRPSPTRSGRKRPSESEGQGRRGKAVSHVEVVDSDYNRNTLPERTRKLYDPNQGAANIPSPQRSATEQSSEWSRDAAKSSQRHASKPQSPSRPQRSAPKTQHGQRQPGLIELQRYDPRYPGLLLQPDSRAVSQEQLASEVKSIYAGLTMVETKCIHVDRAQAAAASDGSDPNHRLASDHWQALIALHRTLLHEHHDFFLASQHPSASLTLRRLAAKYSKRSPLRGHDIGVSSIPTYEIPSVLTGKTGQHNVSALGDTCAMYNFMSPACAASLGLEVDTTASKVVAMGSGGRVKTAGIVRTQYRFEGEPESSYSLLFHILPNAVQDLILGRTFLKLTKTFTTGANRLSRVKKTVLNTLRQHRLLYLGDNAPKFLGRLNETFVDALADTGSNVLVMDETYARERGFPIRRSHEHRTRLLFADGTTKLTSGMTHKMRWQFGASPDSPEHLLEFHILKNAPAPVILNDSLLFDTNAYEEYERYLVEEEEDETDSEEDDGEGHLFHIGLDHSYDAQGQVDKTTIEAKRYEEQERRNRAEDRLASLRGDEYATEWAEELELRSAFDNFIQALKDGRAAAGQAPRVALDPQLLAQAAPPDKGKWYRFSRRRVKKLRIAP